MKRTDPRLTATARLVENLAELLPALRAHIAVELHQLDSIPDHAPGASDPTPNGPSKPLEGHCTANVADPSAPDELIDCGRHRPCPEHDHPVTLTRVEQAAERRRQLTNDLGAIEDTATIIAMRTHDALTTTRRLLGARVELPKPAQCRDGQVGKDGTIEWGQPDCTDPATKAGLCGRHFQAYYRWRKRNGIDTSKMFEAETV